MPFFLVSVILQVLMVLHVVRTGRDTKWIWIILMLPMAGSIAYFLLEVMPELAQTRTARQLHRKVQDRIDPERELRTHSQALEIVDTVDNNIKLARALLEKERFADALPLLERARTGFYKDDPSILLMQAEACFGLQDWQAAQDTLDHLRKANPDFQSQDGHLLYARILEARGSVDAAVHEYEALVRYYNGPEAKCRYGLLLQKTGKAAEARQMFAEVVAAARHHRKHFQRLHGEWLKLAEQELKPPQHRPPK
ncbi:MAG TPA: tetratricopeptide repeat protein [Pseudomonadales bacterium]|nr:tetratricopeptide repeat protein [Pseudomonadales bacterium]